MRVQLETSILLNCELPDALAAELDVKDGQVGLRDESDDGPHLRLYQALLNELMRITGPISPHNFVSADWINWSPICRECGCTEDEACPEGCQWVEPDLCSTHQAAT